MTASRGRAAAFLGLLLFLGACAAQQPTAPKLSDEAACRVAAASHQCKLAHDLAGGYPFSLGSGR